MLVDAGINPEQADAHNRYYKGPLLHLLVDEDEYRLPPDQELGAQLARLGYRPDDLQTVILTHGHEGHVGGCRPSRTPRWSCRGRGGTSRRPGTGGRSG
jgi:glyoxylase-like metal-dependent hydrolase (beta-lactamase superfamily II)